jgi:hypothetical protein
MSRSTTPLPPDYNGPPSYHGEYAEDDQGASVGQSQNGASTMRLLTSVDEPQYIQYVPVTCPTVFKHYTRLYTLGMPLGISHKTCLRTPQVLSPPLPLSFHMLFSSTGKELHCSVFENVNIQVAQC